MGANANVIKKEEKDIFQIKYYNYYKNDYYSYKYSQNLKKELKN